MHPEHPATRHLIGWLFGIFFEEINHTGAAVLWAELTSNSGFETKGPNTPSYISPWSVMGCFDLNKVALHLDMLRNDKGANACPAGRVGIYNPGFWGVNIKKGKTYKVVFHVRSLESVDLSSIKGVSSWTKMEVRLEATATNHNSRLQSTTNQQEVIWFDQVSAMPEDTYLACIVY
ncbi:hypothetical protein MLD38_025957 [Melastoma candidum]|uniref:Uncharacterized protein n=1 Tax=Melastoma candidum TaxID=119954 RepID=A0ACB9NWY1_9MYRT|nr:hypothetical protein MLD38_025957 [Melastoma candidum]